MANVCAKIVLTGGPCAGKTTALSKIENTFRALGYQVLVIPESATELIRSGIKPFGSSALDMVDFQKIIIQHQLNKERIYESAFTYLPKDQNYILIYDRGVMDNKAFITPEEFQMILAEKQLSELELLDRYDMVLHLVTIADQKEEFYTLENNQARTETPEEARLQDQNIMRAWIGHHNFKIIPNENVFEDKMKHVISEICTFLECRPEKKYQYKYLVEIDDKKVLKTWFPVHIKQSYLLKERLEKRLRKRSQGRVETYYYTVQKQDNIGNRKVYFDRKISKEEYERLISTYEVCEIEKARYTTIIEKQRYQLDLFEDGSAVLETDHPFNRQLEGICVKKNITENKMYYNFYRAQKKEKVKEKNKKT